MDKIRVLELFAGSGSVSKACALQPDMYEVTSLDITDKLYPVTFQCDFMKWDYTMFELGYYDLIWASPPCTMYSIARTTGKLPRDIEGSNKLVQRVLDVIAYYKPTIAFLENPASGSLKNQPMMQDLTSFVVHYCMYEPSWGYRKSTQIWQLGKEHIPNFIPKICTKMQRCECFKNGRHPNTFAGKRTTKVPLEQRYKIPQTLLTELLEHATVEIIKERDRLAMV